jgi:hypothetical protein
MCKKTNVRGIHSEFIRDLESRTRSELKSRLQKFRLSVVGNCFKMEFRFVGRQYDYTVMLDPQLFGFWHGLPVNRIESELRKMIASVLSSADRGYHHD